MYIAYLFVEWDEEDEHSVVEGKIVNLMNNESGYVPGASVQCALKEGTFSAKILATGEVYRIGRY